MEIIIDVDDVVFRSMERWVELYNYKYVFAHHGNVNHVICKADLLSWDLTKHVGQDIGKLCYELFSLPGFYSDNGQTTIRCYENALHFVEYRRMLGDKILFASSCTSNQVEAKYKALCDHGFLVSDRRMSGFAAIHDKGMLNGDLMIDDGIHNLKNFSGKKILFTQPWNKSFDAESFDVRRINEWSEML